MFQILHNTVFDGWTNVSHDEHGDPLMFETYAEAADDLREMFESMEAAGMDFAPEDYIITDDESEGPSTLYGDDVDGYVRLYCYLADIEVDGDVFGHYFTGDLDPANGLTPAQIDGTIRSAAATFNLYR